MQGARTLENIFFDADQLSRLSRTEQAQCLEKAERQTDDTNVLPLMIQPPLQWIDQQRQ